MSRTGEPYGYVVLMSNKHSRGRFTQVEDSEVLATREEAEDLMDIAVEHYATIPRYADETFRIGEVYL